jgi:hypothetical protein
MIGSICSGESDQAAIASSQYAASYGPRVDLSGTYFSHSIDRDLSCSVPIFAMGGLWMSRGAAACPGTAVRPGGEACPGPAVCPESRPQPVKAALNIINRRMNCALGIT